MTYHYHTLRTQAALSQARHDARCTTNLVSAAQEVGGGAERLSSKTVSQRCHGSPSASPPAPDIILSGKHFDFDEIETSIQDYCNDLVRLSDEQQHSPWGYRNVKVPHLKVGQVSILLVRGHKTWGIPRSNSIWLDDGDYSLKISYEFQGEYPHECGRVVKFNLWEGE